MKARLFSTIVLLFALAASLVGAVRAQGPGPQGPSAPPVPPEILPAPEGFPLPGPEGKPFAPFAAAEMGAQSVGAAAVPLGQPGLSFRYVQTFGTTEEPYLEDDNHFYEVEGIGTNGTNIWVTDSWGTRVVKFDANGNSLQKIGKAGVTDYTGTPLDYLTDVAVDSSGNIWVVDGGGIWAATSGGVMRWDMETGEHIRLTVDNGLAGNVVQAIAVGPDGSLWFGTLGGVSRYQPGR